MKVSSSVGFTNVEFNKEKDIAIGGVFFLHKNHKKL